MRPCIFVTQPIAASAIERLRAVVEVEVNPDASCLLTKDALLAGVRRNDMLFSLLHDRVDREVIEANPGLRMIATMSITPDNTDVVAATARKIPVTVVPALAIESTADTAFALMLAVARRVVEGDRVGGRQGDASAEQSPVARTGSACGCFIGVRAAWQKKMSAG